MSKQLIYALKDGVVTSVLDVESGLKCGCTCPACDAPLIARHPRASSKQPRMDHFAHANGYNCEFGYQYSLHLAAQDILSKAKKMVIPEVFLSAWGPKEESCKIAERTEIPIDHVELEKHYDGFIPDVVVYSRDKVLFIEICVTHRIDNEKLKKLKEADISTLEFSIGGYTGVSIEELENILLRSGRAVWKHNAYREKFLKEFYNSIEKKDATENKYGDVYAPDCPLPKSARSFRKWTPFMISSIYVPDCNWCPYFWGYEDYGADRFKKKIYCAGKQRIVSLEDYMRLRKKHLQER